jgi:tRNA pseudouridine38-40 synthase
MPETNIRLDIQYKGTDYAGWQFQPDETTVQGEIEKALEKITGKHCSLHGAGRTDAGVHALGQVANFKIDHYLPTEKYKDALNFYLPPTILITNASVVPDNFDARHSANWRHYRYIIDRAKSALYFEYRWEYQHDLDLDQMNDMAGFIIGWHDFASCCTVSSQKDDNRCEVIENKWHGEGSLLIYNIKANRFLHSMVRSLVGLMAEGGRGNGHLTLDNFKDIINAGDHTRIKHVAPARGLYLVEVGY